MEKTNAILAYDWEEMIKRIIEGIQKFFKLIEFYMPTAVTNYEKEGYLKDYEAE